MASTPPLRMLKGLASSPMDASPDHCSVARNFVSRDGILQVSPGMRGHRALGAEADTGAVFGTADNDDAPTNVAVNLTGGEKGEWLYMGFSSRVYQFQVWGAAADAWPTQAAYTAAFTVHDDIQFQVWNGTAWVDVGVGNQWKPFVVNTNRIASGPFMSYSAGVSAEGYMLNGIVDPAATWASKTIDGFNRYWLRAAIPAFDVTQYSHTPPTDIGVQPTLVTTTELRIKSVLTFRDRAAAPHEFVALQASSVLMRYFLDGTELTVADSLQPDGLADAFSSGQVVTAHYHKSTDRVIGCIDGFNWFYLLPNEGVIYALLPDDQAVDTPYEGLIGGLRSALPQGAVTAIFDDRLFTAVGNTLYWSAPGVYADVWANDFEISLGDGGGDITGLAAVAGALVVFKRNGIYVVQSAGTSDDYVGYPVPGNVGCIAPRGAYAYANEVRFPAEDGVYSFNGSETRKLSDSIDEYWNTVVQGGALDGAIGVVSSENEEYRLFHGMRGGDPDVCPNALFMSFRGSQPAFWPQGPEDSDGYGFQATAVCVDQVRPRERIIIGDRWGCLWIADEGAYVCGERVTGEITSARINPGTAQKAMARWVGMTVDAVRKQNVTVTVWPNDMQHAQQSSVVDSAGDNQTAAFAVAGRKVLVGDLVIPLYEMQVLPSQTFQCKGRFFRVRIDAEYPYRQHAAEIDFHLLGRHG